MSVTYLTAHLHCRQVCFPFHKPGVTTAVISSSPGINGEKSWNFNLKIQSRVIEGELNVEIYNKDGKKQGKFSVGSQINSDNSKEEVNGLIRKSIDNAPIGIWTIKIIPKNVTGYITINYSQEKIVKK